MIDLKKVVFAIIALGIAIIVAFWGQPLIHNNDQAVNVIVTVFSILAGFLIAIIAILGDPSMIPHGSWRIAEIKSKDIFKRLTKHKYLFVLYLVTLLLVFCSVLLKDKDPTLTLWIERIYLFVSTFAFMMSLWLPFSLENIQRERIELVIHNRRRDNGIND